MVGSLRSALLIATALTVCGTASAEGATEPVYQFDIQAQPLSQALTEFSQASAQQIIYSEDLTKDHTAPALRGNYTAGKALGVLLAGTDLKSEPSASGVLMIQKRETAGSAETPETVIVTGTARAERRFDVDYAVNSLSQDQVAKLAPINYADMLGMLPGIQVEATGGEVQNITRVRGIPDDRGYLVFQQDGLPFFQEIDGYFFNSGDGMNRYDLMTERVEVVRGGPSAIYASDAAAIANNITVTGSDKSRGKAQVTLGDSGLYRIDAMQSGALTDNTHYAIGGFLRYNSGYRDNGFPTDKGGQLRANITRDLGHGTLKISGTYLNDHNVFYLPIPVADPNNPSVSLNKYINYFSGTMNSPVFRNVTISYQDGNGVTRSLNRDLSNGRHITFANLATSYEGNFDDWLVSFKAGYTVGKLDFDALYSTTNPYDANAFEANFFPKAQAAFASQGSVARLGFALAGTNGSVAYDPYAASGLVMQAQYRAVTSSFYSGQSDLSVGHKFETGFGSHDIKIGVYDAIWHLANFKAYQVYLIEVASKPRTLDLAAYSANGSVLGYVTDHGALNDASTLASGKTDASMIALYANDTWDIIQDLRLDAGIRQEWYNYNGVGAEVASQNRGNALTLADDSSRYFTGATYTHTMKPKATNWTVGLNYDFNANFGTYGRVSHTEVPPSSGEAYSDNPSTTITKANQYEFGFKAAFERSYFYVTGFYTKFDPLDASFTAYNPQTGRNDQTLDFVGTATVMGVEIDGNYSPLSWLSIAGSLTINDPQYQDLFNNAGADPHAVNGKQIVREPKIYGNIRPTVNFDLGGDQFEVYGRYEYTGKRFVDYFNQTALPSYDSIGAGITATHGDWKIQLVGDNLANAHGLTEGNPRTDVLNGQGNKTAVYGRPVFGRSFRLIVGTSW